MTQIAVASDGKLKTGFCPQEDGADVTGADMGTHFTSRNKKGERKIQSHLKKVSDSSWKHQMTSDM